MDEVYFRIDANKSEGFHCHIRGYGSKPEKGGHIPFQDVIPRPTVSPFDFLNLVEQFVTTVLAMADYVYLLNRGRLAFVGDPDELAERDIVGAYLGAGVS